LAKRTPTPGNEPLSGVLAAVCVGCGADLRVRTGQGVVEVAGGPRGPLTYADTDIVVWDCPRCGVPNADVLDG